MIHSDLYEEFFYSALRIRLVEERIIELYPRFRVRFICLSGRNPLLWESAIRCYLWICYLPRTAVMHSIWRKEEFSI